MHSNSTPGAFRQARQHLLEPDQYASVLRPACAMFGGDEDPLD